MRPCQKGEEQEVENEPKEWEEEEEEEEIRGFFLFFDCSLFSQLRTRHWLCNKPKILSMGAHGDQIIVTEKRKRLVYVRVHVVEAAEETIHA